MKVVIALFLLAVLLLSPACAHGVTWTKTGAGSGTQQDLNTDLFQCHKDVSQMTYGGSATNGAYWNRYMDECMAIKGWSGT